METETLAPSDAAPTPTAIERYAAYPFNEDRQYQILAHPIAPSPTRREHFCRNAQILDVEKEGLADIMLGWSFDKEPTAETREEMLRRTRVFYFNKVTGSSLTMDEARDYERSKGRSPEASASPEPEEPRVLSFAELKELIESGRVDQIPNNKVIPEKLSEAPPSQSTAPARKKPWEVAQEIQAIPSGQ